MILTKRGQFILGLAIALGIIALFSLTVYVMGHINWVDDHYCWGTIAKCYLENGK